MTTSRHLSFSFAAFASAAILVTSVATPAFAAPSPEEPDSATSHSTAVVAPTTLAVVSAIVQRGHTDIMGVVSVVDPCVEGAQCVHCPDAHRIGIGVALVVVGNENDILLPCTIVIDAVARRDDNPLGTRV